MADASQAASARSQTAAGSRPAQSTRTLPAGCVNPIRLRGFYQRIAADTGEVLSVLGSPENADTIMTVACKDRRASRCPSCSRLYERDAYQLLAAGLRGGKTVPTIVDTHPAVMLTLTAPSFGPVHGSRDNGRPCRCGVRHAPDDPQLGTPIDAGRYRYAEQVVWNRYAPELWKRTVQAIRRGLANALGAPRSELAQIAKVRFAKVAEFQRRGVVHYHAIIRVDGGKDIESPLPERCTPELLAQIVDAAAAMTSVALPESLAEELALRSPAKLRWGAQREVAPLDPHTCTAAAGYIAKYATKATEAVTGGTLLRPIRSPSFLARIPIAAHPRALITAAWRIGERTGDDAFKRWAHQFGYGGHTLTKSHHYSTTFAALRTARSTWHLGSADESAVIVRANLTYAGRGRPNPESPR